MCIAITEEEERVRTEEIFEWIIAEIFQNYWKIITIDSKALMTVRRIDTNNTKHTTRHIIVKMIKSQIWKTKFLRQLEKIRIIMYREANKKNMGVCLY